MQSDVDGMQATACSRLGGIHLAARRINGKAAPLQLVIPREEFLVPGCCGIDCLRAVFAFEPDSPGDPPASG
jgi:hypothetical protein